MTTEQVQKDGQAGRDRAWLFRTYAGHSTAAASNALFRKNLAHGQTGLSVAFDLPTQTGYDSDHPLAAPEVGKVGVPVGHLGDMRALFEGIPLERMNTSMTINATAPWLLALYIALAEERGLSRASLSGTTQNDIIKEYLSRGTHIFPPEPSMRLTTDTVAFTVGEVPRWNPINVCSYHLQEAGATPVQELAYALANAIAVLDALRDGGKVPVEDFPKVVGRISFFVNAGLRFVTELCKMRAFAELWDEICRERYGVEEEKYRRLRYGVQVNSLGLTEQQPENNVYRILLEMLAVTLSRASGGKRRQAPPGNRVRRAGGGRRQRFHRKRTLALAVRGRRRLPHPRRHGGGGTDRASEGLASGARRRRGDSGLGRSQGRRWGRAQRYGAVDCLCPCRGDHGRMGRRLARGLRRVSCAHRGRWCRRAVGRRKAGGGSQGGRRGLRAAR
jgi:hypothetical protein